MYKYLAASLAMQEEKSDDFQGAYALIALVRHRFLGEPMKSSDKEWVTLLSLLGVNAALQRKHGEQVIGLKYILAIRSKNATDEERALKEHVSWMSHVTCDGKEGYAWSVVHLARFYTRTMQYEKAVYLLDVAHRILHQDERLLLELASLHVSRGFYDKAKLLHDQIEDALKARHRYDAAAILAQLQTQHQLLLELPTSSSSIKSERLSHLTMGSGDVISRDGRFVTLRMDDGTQRTFLAGRLVVVSGKHI
jgi:tetratricopeptide (TPR) repeat protein